MVIAVIVLLLYPLYRLVEHVLSYLNILL